MQHGLLSEQISQQLLKQLREGIYSQVSRLPPEMEIAAQLNVSRTVVRDSLAALEREGFITRKHGVGTIVNRHVLAVKTRMDLEEEFLDMIRNAGYTPGVADTRVRYSRADEYLAERLQIAPGDELIQVWRLINADGIPAISCVDSLPKALVQSEDYDLEELRKPIFCFLKNYCLTDVFMDLTEVEAVAATEELANDFGVEVGTPLLRMNELGFDLRGRPVLHSDEHYRTGLLHHTVLRKKI